MNYLLNQSPIGSAELNKFLYTTTTEDLNLEELNVSSFVPGVSVPNCNLFKDNIQKEIAESSQFVKKPNTTATNIIVQVASSLRLIGALSSVPIMKFV